MVKRPVIANAAVAKRKGAASALLLLGFLLYVAAVRTVSPKWMSITCFTLGTIALVLSLVLWRDVEL